MRKVVENRTEHKRRTGQESVADDEVEEGVGHAPYDGEGDSDAACCEETEGEEGPDRGETLGYHGDEVVNRLSSRVKRVMSRAAQRART